MGESKALVYIVVVTLSIAAAALAFTGEATRIKKSDVIVTTNGCEYPRNSGGILGFTALAAIISAQVIIVGVTKFGGYYRKRPSEPQLPQATGTEICSFLISWFASSIGMGLLFAAAFRSTRQQSSTANVRCNFVRVAPGIFAVGGALALVACVSGLWSYRASTKYNPQPALANIAMGTPQFDTTPMNPYVKQQQYA